jgi:hypothetical protein
MFLLAACLPQEKTTQCNENEAYNATSRKCQATLGATNTAINITNVTPSSSYVINTSAASPTHAVTVSDPYNSGYQVQWKVTNSNGISTNLATGLSLTFNHAAYAAGAYVLEVILFDTLGTTHLDSRSWTVNIIDETTPTITPITATPFSTTTTSAVTAISATANNPDAIASVNYQWYVNGSAVAGQSGTFSGTTRSLSLNFDPSSTSGYYTGANIYNTQLILTENTTGNTYSTFTWLINNGIPNYSNVTLGTSAFTTITPTTASIITVIDNLEISNNGFLYDVDTDSTLDSIDFCVKADVVTGVDGDGLFVDFLMDGVLLPNPLKVSKQMTVAGTSYCLQEYYDFKYDIPNNIIQESHTLTAVVYDKYTGSINRPTYNGYTQVETLSWTLRVRQANTPPVITIDSTTTNIQYDTIVNNVNLADSGHTCTSSTPTTETGCHISQDTPFTVAITVTDDDYNPADYTNSTIGFEKFRVEFKIDGVNIDGATPTVTSSNCYYDFLLTGSAARYKCDLTINSYDASGPIVGAGASYTITAKVTDSDSPYAAATPTESNTVSWTISTVTESNTGVTVNAFDTTAAATIATESYIALQSASGVAINANVGGALVEGDKIEIIVNVTEPERDGHTIKISRCLDALCGVVTELDMITKVINSTDNTNPRISIINHTIGEDEVVGDDEALVYYRIIVEDTGGYTSSTIATLEVEDFNPDSVFAGTLLPVTATTYTAFVGFPFSIDPGVITDASLSADSDGENTSYQWMIRVDSDNDGSLVGETWSAITGATSRTLTWTPSSEIDFLNSGVVDGKAVQIKLCIGDDGWDTPLNVTKSPLNTLPIPNTECADITGRDSSDYDSDGIGPIVASPWNLTVYSNMAYGNEYHGDTVNNTGDGQLAVWVDPTSTDPIVKYIAYQSNSNELIIEKIVTSADGTKHGTAATAAVIAVPPAEVASIRYPTTSTASNPITNLSMTGDTTNGALYIAFMSPYSGAGGNDSVHVRRIDISGGKTGFTHGGKFGVDRSFDGLENNIIITSTEIANETTNAYGLIEIAVQGSDANTSSINFSGIMGGNITLTEGTDFCTTACTTATEIADSIVLAINSSTHTELQGITANQTLNTIVLSGIAQDDFIQLDISATSIGKIVTNQTTGQWELPYIDNARTGVDKNKISILYGALGSRLNQGTASTHFVSATVPAQEITNTLDDNDRILLVTKAYSTGEVALYEYTTAAGPTYTFSESDTNLFSTTTINSLKVKVGRTTANTSAFVVGKNTANNEVALARIDSVANDYNIAGAYVTTDLDSNVSFANIPYYDISAGAQAQELFIGTMDSTVNAVYIMQVKGATPTLECNNDDSGMAAKTYCQKIQTNSSTDVFSLPIVMSQVIENVALGTDGNTVGENTKDIMVFGFHSDDGGGNSAVDAIPTTSIINVEETSITGDVTGTNYDVTYGIPYVGL